MTTAFSTAANYGLTVENLDIQIDYKDEVAKAMQIVIARAWMDPAYKSELIADPNVKLAELGVHYPDHFKLEFFDDPSAKVGDWTTTGKNQTAVLRVPIPAPPPGGNVASDDLEMLASAADNCCCCTGLCTCTGAASQDTWY
jgi:hypothetical protein